MLLHAVADLAWALPRCVAALGYKAAEYETLLLSLDRRIGAFGNEDLLVDAAFTPLCSLRNRDRQTSCMQLKWKSRETAVDCCIRFYCITLARLSLIVLGFAAQKNRPLTSL